MTRAPLHFQPTSRPQYPRWSETLRDRTQVLIRPIVQADRSAQSAFLQRLSAESRRYRFLGTVRSPDQHLLDRLTEIDYAHEVTFVATVKEDGHDRIVGLSRYRADEPGLRCECEVIVSDDWRQKGLGTSLMRHLIEVARARKIRTMYAIDCAENLEMRDLASFLGFHTRPDPDDEERVIHSLDLHPEV